MHTEIENEWIVELGMYEPGKPIEEVARELGIDDVDDICKLAANENSMGASPRVIETIRAQADKMHLYPDGGAFYLRRALAEQLGVEMDHLVMGNGSNELIELIGHVYLKEGANIVMGDRAFVVYRLVAMAHRSEVKAVPMPNFTHDLSAMLDAVDEKTKIIFIANPNNPTGTMLHQQELDDFMSRIPDHVAVVFDEAYIELLEEKDRPDMLKYLGGRRHVYVLRTFSKAYGLAGLRLGYSISSEADAKLLHRVRQPFNTNAMAQAAALTALDDQQHVAETRTMVHKGMIMLEQAFEELGLEYVPSVTNFVLVKTGYGRHAFLELQKKKMIVRPMDGYQLPDWIRVTVGTQEENRRLINALKELMKERADAS